MKVELLPVGVGVAAGAIDEILEWRDEVDGRTDSFKTWSDWGRIALTAIGYLGQAFNKMPRICAPLAQSEVTLLTKSVGSAIRTGAFMKSGVARPRTSTWRGKISQTAGPGFKGLETY